LTGREKVEAALSESGTSEIPAVIPYEGIYIRDHWKELVCVPWWYHESPDIKHQMLWHREVIEKMGQDWFRIPRFEYSREDRKNIFIENRPDGIFQIDRRTGEKNNSASHELEVGYH